MNHNITCWFNDKPATVLVAYLDNFSYLTGSVYEEHTIFKF
jgi:hypothetical protein